MARTDAAPRARLDALTRVTAWAFAQVMLPAAWIVQDGGRVEPDDGWLLLAERLHVRVTYDDPAGS